MYGGGRFKDSEIKEIRVPERYRELLLKLCGGANACESIDFGESIDSELGPLFFVRGSKTSIGRGGPVEQLFNSMLRTSNVNE